MQLDFAFLAKYAELSPDGVFTAFGAGGNTLSGALPLVIPNLSFLFRLSTRPDEAGRNFQIRIRPIAPNGGPIPGSEGVVPFVPVENRADATQPATFTSVVNFVNLTLHEAGQYRIELSLVDGDNLGNLAFTVVPQAHEEQPNA
jgi:hypothetical protein